MGLELTEQGVVSNGVAKVRQNGRVKKFESAVEEIEELPPHAASV